MNLYKFSEGESADVVELKIQNTWIKPYAAVGNRYFLLHFSSFLKYLDINIF